MAKQIIGIPSEAWGPELPYEPIRKEWVPVMDWGEYGTTPVTHPNMGRGYRLCTVDHKLLVSGGSRLRAKDYRGTDWAMMISEEYASHAVMSVDSRWVRAVEGRITRKIYPHRCPECRAPALMLFSSIECGSIGCKNFKLGRGA